MPGYKIMAPLGTSSNSEIPLNINFLQKITLVELKNKQLELFKLLSVVCSEINETDERK